MATPDGGLLNAVVPSNDDDLWMYFSGVHCTNVTGLDSCSRG